MMSLLFPSVYSLAPTDLLVFISCLLSNHPCLSLVILASSFCCCCCFWLCVQFLAPVSLLCSFFFPLICWLSSVPPSLPLLGVSFRPPFLLLWDFVFLLVDGGWYCKHHKNIYIENRWFLWCPWRTSLWVNPECSGLYDMRVRSAAVRDLKLGPGTQHSKLWNSSLLPTFSQTRNWGVLGNRKYVPIFALSNSFLPCPHRSFFWGPIPLTHHWLLCSKHQALPSVFVSLEVAPWGHISAKSLKPFFGFSCGLGKKQQRCHS